MEQQINLDNVTPDQVFEQMPTFFQADRAGNTNATILFDLSGEQGGQWWIKIADGVTNAQEVALPPLTRVRLTLRRHRPGIRILDSRPVRGHRREPEPQVL